ncbi:MAG: acetoin utilization AcuB family protein [Deltaproteobacteria bacterium]
MQVGRRMTKHPKTVSPGDSLARAAQMMREHRFHHLPVVEGGKLVGILSDTDLRNAALAAGKTPAPGELPVSDRKVGEAMQTEVWSLTPEDSVEDALLILRRKRFGCLPVVSGEKLVGILTKTDLIDAFVDVLEIDGVGVRVEVLLPRSLERFEELVAIVRDLGVELRSCLISPDERGSDRMAVLLRFDTINGPMVRGALRAKHFEVLEPGADTL